MVRWNLVAVLHVLRRCMDEGGDQPSTTPPSGISRIDALASRVGTLELPNEWARSLGALYIITPRSQSIGPCRTE